MELPPQHSLQSADKMVVFIFINEWCCLVDDTDNNSAQAATTVSSSLDALLAQADKARKARSLAKNAKANSFISKLIEFAKTVDTFSQSIDVYVQGSGAISAIIWGSIRVVIKVPPFD